MQGNQLRGIALGKALACIGQRRIDQGRLAAQQLIYAQGKRSPLILGQIEVAAQIEPGGLLDHATDTGGLHEAVGDVGLAGASGCAFRCNG